jgi:malate dehydrogenase (oxaloacetate-decarboxylating)(NADP+)
MNPLQVSVKGSDVLTDPLFNKGTAFKSGERDRLRIRGLLPPRMMNIRE